MYPHHIFIYLLFTGKVVRRMSAAPPPPPPDGSKRRSTIEPPVTMAVSYFITVCHVTVLSLERSHWQCAVLSDILLLP